MKYTYFIVLFLNGDPQYWNTFHCLASKIYVMCLVQNCQLWYMIIIGDIIHVYPALDI